MEEELVNYGSEIYSSIKKIQIVLTSVRDFYIAEGEFKKFQGQREDAYFETKNPTKCNSFIECDYRDVYDKDKIVRYFARLASDNPCGIEFRFQDRSDCITFKVYPESLTVESKVFVKEIYEKFNNEIKNFSILYTSKDAYLKKMRI
ncbi:hypothetical protein [Clostridium tagluense]|uniref:hypothetical protein n=1 Tax=Clostridium tagluense TaxID=360422 RepID=UPI001CF2BA38|nr:hypothetical protein [Clostridium tagluense]MCB2297945.1 hypothetical protein [Clostridium tagluense]